MLADAKKTLEALRSGVESIEAGTAKSIRQSETLEGTNDDTAPARTIILRQLSASAKSRHQLYVKLVESEIDPTIANQVLDRFEELRLIDDAQFAQDWVNQRHEFRGLAPLALRRELQEKGIPKPYIEDALSQLDSDDERSRAIELIEKKLRTIPLLDSTDTDYRKNKEKYARRLVSHLQRKGYNSSVSFGIVNELLDQHQLLI